jgi:hypothetical protein
MKNILKKSLKVSFASILAIKAGDYASRKITIKSPINFKQAECVDFDNPSDDIVTEMLKTEFNTDEMEKLPYEWKCKYSFLMKSRDEHLKEMMDPNTNFDILIIGGGANGSGVALEAASRGLKCAVIDAYDFAAGTSSRSTKMAHGGVRYFEKMMKLDGDPFENYELLKETL